jgi:hypothetical protein
MLSTPLYDLVDPTNHLGGQDRLLISLGGGIVNISGHPGALSFLGGTKLPLPRKKEILVLPFRVAGELRVDLDKLPPSRLEVVNRRTLRVLLEPVEVQKLSYCVAPQILIVLFLIYLFDNIIQLISLRSLWYYGGW